MAFIVTPTGTARARGKGSPTITVFVKSDFEKMLEADLEDVFISPDNEEFNTPAVYQHTTGENRTYTVIFDNPGASVSVRVDAEFNTLRPHFKIQETKLARPIKKEDRVLIKGIKYHVDIFKSDGVGVTTAYLRTA